MRVVVQRVQSASVRIQSDVVGRIGQGLLLFVAFEAEDNQQEIDWMVKKILNLRIFNDSDGKMNLSVLQTGGESLVISQFTLFASTKKGNRPSYIRSASPEIAIQLYEQFIATLAKEHKKEPATGRFGADMQVELVNDGPVTISIDSIKRE